MTRAEWALTAVVAFALLYAAVLLIVWARHRHRFDRETVARQEALERLPPEPVDDPCVSDGCGHARGLHYERSDRTRGACRDPECYCAKFTPDRPVPVLLGVPYQHGFWVEGGAEIVVEGNVVYDQTEGEA